MKRIAVIGVTGLALVVAAGCAGPSREVPRAQLVAAPAGTNSELRTITGVGTGDVLGTPDTLTMELGVEVRSDSAADALRRSTEQTEKVLDVLDGAGVRKEDIQTSGLSVAPEFDEDGEGIIGYTASNHLTVTTHDLERAGDVIDAAAGTAGDAIRVDGVSFSIEDTSELVRAARADAVKKAGEQAQELAEAAGVELAEIQSIEENTSTPYVAEADARSQSTAAPVPIEPGTQELSVSVVVVYRIA